jgi:hypothetical protein
MTRYDRALNDTNQKIELAIQSEIDNIFKSKFKIFKIKVDFSDKKNQNPENYFETIKKVESFEIIRIDGKPFILFELDYDEYRFYDRYNMEVFYFVSEYKFDFSDIDIKLFLEISKKYNYKFNKENYENTF